MNQPAVENRDTREQKNTALLVGAALLVAGVAALVEGEWLIAAIDAFAVTGLFVNVIPGSQHTSAGSGGSYWITRLCAAAVFLLAAYGLLF